MAQIFSLKSAKYGTPTGLSTMPDAGSMNALPDTVKGSVSLDEGDPTIERKYVDQKTAPKRVIVTEMGEVTHTLQFMDIDYDTLAAIKGGEAIAGVVDTSPAKWKNGTEFTTVNLAIQLETDSGHYFNYYNAFITAKIVGSGSRDGQYVVEMTVVPQLTADGTGDWEISDVAAPTA